MWWNGGTYIAAGVAYEANKPLSFEDIHVAPPQPTEVRVKITHACICQSDLYFWKGKVTLLNPMIESVTLLSCCLCFPNCIHESRLKVHISFELTIWFHKCEFLIKRWSDTYKCHWDESPIPHESISHFFMCGYISGYPKIISQDSGPWRSWVRKQSLYVKKFLKVEKFMTLFNNGETYPLVIGFTKSNFTLDKTGNNWGLPFESILSIWFQVALPENVMIFPCSIGNSYCHFIVINIESTLGLNIKDQLNLEHD